MTKTTDCGLVGCAVSRRLQGVVEHGSRWLLPRGQLILHSSNVV